MSTDEADQRNRLVERGSTESGVQRRVDGDEGPPRPWRVEGVEDRPRKARWHWPPARYWWLAVIAFLINWMDTLARTLLERESLDEDDAYAAAGVSRRAAPVTGSQPEADQVPA